MSKELIKQEIAHLLETITEQAEIIYEHEHKIPQIEMDIMLGNVRNLYEQLLSLNKLGKAATPIITDVPKPEVTLKTTVSEIVPQQLKTPEPIMQVTEIEQPVLEMPVEKQESIVEKIEVLAAIAEPKIPVSPVLQESIVEKIEIAAAIAELEIAATPTIQERIVAQVEVAPASAEPIISIAPEKPESIIEKIEIAAAIAEPEILFNAPKVITPVIEMPIVATPVEQPKPEIKIEPKINIQEEIVVKAAIAPEKNEAEKAVRQKPKTAGSLFDAPQSLGGQFDESQSLKEKISGTKIEKSIGDKFGNQQKIIDLKKAIGINEKFLFINELFEGSLASYNEHIDKINASAESNHALSIVDSLVSKYNWNTDQDIVKKFMDLVQRRFL